MSQPARPPDAGGMRSQTPVEAGAGQAEPASMAHAIYDATVKELQASHDPNLQRQVLHHLDAMLRGGDQDRALVTSAVALTPDERRALEQKLRAKFGRDLAFEYRVDPALLGGIVAKVGDKIIDGSLASRLNAMQEALLGAR